MQIHRFLSTIAVILLLLIGFRANAQWQLKKNSNGIKIYVKKAADSNFYEYKGEVTVDAGIDAVGMVLRDVSANKEWMSGCLTSRIIEKYDNNNYLIYYVQDLPWPASDRDMLIEAKTTINYTKGTVSLTMATPPRQRVAPNPDYVRITNMKGQYTLQYISRHKTQITYTNFADPAGSLPTSLVNTLSVDIPYDTLAGLRRMATTTKYTNMAATSADAKQIDQLVANGILPQ